MSLLLLLKGGSAGVTHDTSGALTGPGAVVAGSANRTREHDATGSLSGPGAVVAGDAARTRAHATDGALSGPGSSVTGDAARTRAHATDGALSGAGAAVAGSANRFRAHATDGALTGPGAAIVGSAERSTEKVEVSWLEIEAGAAAHDTSGVLNGPGAIIVGNASIASSYLRGEGWIPQIKRKRKWREEADERAQLRKLIEQAVDPVEAKEAEVVTVKDKVTILPKGERGIPIPVPPQFDQQAVVRLVMQVLHDREIEAKRVREAQARARARQIIAEWQAENERRRLKRRREEEFLLLM